MIALTMRADEIIHRPYPFQGNYMVILEMGLQMETINSSPRYNVYIGDSTKRIFKDGTLPTFIKSKLAMIKSIPKEEWNIEQYEDYLLEVDCYAHRKNFTKNPEFQNIGWCMSDSIYVIILSEEELSELKGIRIDTREKSQSKSKTNS